MKSNSNRAKKGKRGRPGGRNSKATIAHGSGRASSLALIVEPWLPTFPSSVVRRLRYSDSITLNSASGVVSSYVLRANDLFDPDFTGTGHQPMGFDQLMLVYNHFCVIKARLICVFRSILSNTATVAIRYDGASAPITVPNRIIELGGCVIDDVSFLATTNEAKELTLDLDIAKLQAVKKSAITADPTLRGDAATSPTEVTYFHIQMWNTNSTTCSCIVDFILEQTAHFMEPRDNVES